MQKGLILVLLIFVVFSCADLKRKELLTQVEKYQNELNEMSNRLDSLSINDVSEIKNNTLQTELHIKQNLKLDTINLVLAQQLEAFKLMRKSIKPLMQQYSKAKKGIVEEKQVLKNLHLDIEEDRGERHRYNEYIGFERQKLNQLKSLSTDYFTARAKFFNDYKLLSPPIEALALELMKKNNR
jgi:hypothetical protein